MLLNDMARSAPTILAAFLASLVGVIEALTVVLAVGAMRGWRGALGGTGLALLLLALLVLILGPATNRWQTSRPSSLSWSALGVVPLDYRRGPDNEISRKAGWGKSARPV